MVAFRHTSTSLGTWMRSALAMLRPAARAAPRGAAQAHVARARAAIERTLHTTYPSLLTPAHALELLYGPGRLPGPGHLARRFTTQAPRAQPFNGAFRRAGYRPAARAVRGPAVPATVGLGKARTFATAPAAGSIPGGAGNVPVVLRAFVNIFDDDEKLPMGRHYSPYIPRKQRAQRAQRTRSRARQLRRPSASSAATTESAILSQLARYFPVRPEPEIVLPTLPEHLITPGVEATLSLPLAPSLHMLLEPTASLPYADAEIGVAILAGLTHGMMPLHDVFAAASNRVIPLLARLESLGVLDRGSEPRTSLELVTDARGNPDILRIVFYDRAVEDVYALLAEQLVDEGWWAITEKETPSARLTLVEEQEIMERWDAVADANARRRARAARASVPMPPRQVSSVELVMPTIDASVPALVDPWHPPPELPALTPVSPLSTPSVSGLTTPASLELESNYEFEQHEGFEDLAVSTWTTPSDASTSVISFYAESISDRSSDDGTWSVYPSDEDHDVVTASSMSGTSVSVVGPVAEDELEYEIGWVGQGLGLGAPW